MFLNSKVQSFSEVITISVTISYDLKIVSKGISITPITNSV